MRTSTLTDPPRSKFRSIWRGMRRRCPRCGRGPVLAGYLAVTPRCPVCGERLGHIRADDGPAYFTVLVAGHIVVPISLWVEQTWAPPVVPHIIVAILLTCLLIWQLLPSMKGAVVGLMGALRLQGYERHDQE